MTNFVGDIVSITDGPITVPASGTTTLAELDVSRFERILFQFDVATQALDAFLIQARAHTDANYRSLYSIVGDYTSPTGILVGASGDLTTVAASGNGWFILDCKGLDGLRILASSAVDSAAVTWFASVDFRKSNG